MFKYSKVSFHVTVVLTRCMSQWSWPGYAHYSLQYQQSVHPITLSPSFRILSSHIGPSYDFLLVSLIMFPQSVTVCSFSKADCRKGTLTSISSLLSNNCMGLSTAVVMFDAAEMLLEYGSNLVSIFCLIGWCPGVASMLLFYELFCLKLC